MLQLTPLDENASGFQRLDTDAAPVVLVNVPQEESSMKVLCHATEGL
jgi:hypothetical protein